MTFTKHVNDALLESSEASFVTVIDSFLILPDSSSANSEDNKTGMLKVSTLYFALLFVIVIFTTIYTNHQFI